MESDSEKIKKIWMGRFQLLTDILQCEDCGKIKNIIDMKRVSACSDWRCCFKFICTDCNFICSICNKHFDTFYKGRKVNDEIWCFDCVLKNKPKNTKTIGEWNGPSLDEYYQKYKECNYTEDILDEYLEFECVDIEKFIEK